MNDQSSIDTDADPFALDVQVVADLTPDGAAGRCNTDDGCAATCASSCASRG
jgi:FxLD family lantipeptide